MRSMESDKDYLFGKWLANPERGEEVVIAGMSGRFPESDNTQQFLHNLFNEKDMVTEDDRRWTLDHPEVPKRSPKINNINKLDAGFFGLHHRQASIMDPMMRKHLETAVEAVMDAGVNPSELEGSRTGVFIGACYSDMETKTLIHIEEPQKFGITGYLRSFLCNRLSYYLKLKGPSVIVDTACSSSLNALELAVKAIRSGQCDNAIVGGVNILLHPGITIQFYRLGLLSDDGTCKVFDESADGYVRGEAIVSVFLQKAKNARRAYAQIAYAKVNSDGYKPQGITFPSTQMQQQLMTEIFTDSNTVPDDLSYLEAHGTGTEVGDPEEVEAIDRAIGQKRQKPLLIGAVKSSIGHSEPASGLSALVKVIIAMETGRIPPNIKLQKIKSNLTGVLEGRLKIVDEETDLVGDDAYVGLNNFGFGGNNCHVLVRRFNKVKDMGRNSEDDTPRLVCVSGRTKEAVLALLDDLNRRPLDREYVGLINHLFKKNFPTHFYRGYTIISQAGSTSCSCTNFYKSSPFCLYFGQLNNYKTLARFLLDFPVFKNTILSINRLLLNTNTNAIEVNEKNEIECNNYFLGVVAVQIGIVEILKSLALDPTIVYGDSVGKIAIAYYKQEVTLKEAVLAVQKSVKINENHLEQDFQELLPNLKSPVLKRKYRYFPYRNDSPSDVENIREDFIGTKSLKNIPKDAIVLNISDKQRLFTKELLLVENDTVKLLEVLGKLYEQGQNPQLDKLYPEVEYPVSRGTPMISPLIKWDYNKDWYTYRFTNFNLSASEHMEHRIGILSDEWKYISGHVIDGRNLVPAAEYLLMVWKTLAHNQKRLIKDLPVVFENCRFLKATIIANDIMTRFFVYIDSASGNFEVLDDDSLIVTGRIFSPADINKYACDLKPILLEEDDPTLVMKQDEIYRELYIRGYSYSGLFKGITKCNSEASTGLIQWEENWTTFIDKMFQMKILQTDTRLLYVPVSLKKIVIDPVAHLRSVRESTEVTLPVYAYKESGVIKSGGIEVNGLQAKPIPRKKPTSEPVLERYEFVPNEGQFKLPEAIRININIVLENISEISPKVVELVDRSGNSDDFLMTSISQVFKDIPLIKPNLIISTDSIPEKIPGVNVEHFQLTETSNVTLIVGKKIFQQSSLNHTLNALNSNGFVLTKEDSDFVPRNIEDINILTQYVVPDGKLILFQKVKGGQDTKFVEVTSSNFEWLKKLQLALKDRQNIILFSQNEEFDGLLGLVNCIRREPGGNVVRCFLMMDEAPKFDPKHPFYATQINKNLAVNVYKDFKWGTYRHLLLEDLKEVEHEHLLLNTAIKGDLSSIRWFGGHLTTQTSLRNGQILVQNYYSSLNFKDVMIAASRISTDIFCINRLEQEYWLGQEFCGRDMNGRRVAGMINSSGFSTLLVTDFFWEIPDSWTMEDAATVPVVYSTLVYVLFWIASLEPGSSILIHSAAGGIGLAALNICLHYKCNIFVTVGTEEKRDFLKKHFPQISDSHIGNSRDTSFEKVVKTETKGHGVDLVLNSLIGDKLVASIRCLKRGGKFLEIGKYDLANDSYLCGLLLEKEISYHGIGLDRLHNPEIKAWIIDKIREGVKLGFVKPLPRVVFEQNEVEKAFKYMTAGKHIGKILVKLQDEENISVAKPSKKVFKGLPRFSCHPEKCYVIVGGLGGFGLELADWFVLRGARKLVLVTSSGLKTGYQSHRLGIWKSYGVQVQISTCDVTNFEGCLRLLEEASELGPVDGIFNLAAVLQDALFEDQTEEKFRISLAPKAFVTKYLDMSSRKRCPNLRYFVVFSSVSCGRGNPGQTNYGMANSIMERVCEKRKRDGLPGLAIQWGAIGEVGLVAKMQKESKELVIGGTLQQKVSSCLEALDRFLNQDHPVVASMVVANESKGDVAETVLDTVANILGIQDMESVDPNTSLAELGMDSITGTEIIQTLDKCFDIYITTKDIRSITVKRLLELEAEKKGTSTDKTIEKAGHGTNFFLQFIPNSETSNKPIIKLPSQIKDDEKGATVFVFCGVEGVFNLLEPLTNNLNMHVLGVQYSYNEPEDTVQEIAKTLLPHIEKNIGEDKTFRILAYSFGVLVALEVVVMLEENGYSGMLIAVDGSPVYVSAAVRKYLPAEDEATFQVAVISKLAEIVLPVDILKANQEKLLRCDSLQERLNVAFSLIPLDISKKEKLEKQAAVVMYNRFKAAIGYSFRHKQIQSRVKLFKCKYPMIEDIKQDYELSEIFQHPVDVTTIDGDHVTILQQQQLVHEVNMFLS